LREKFNIDKRIITYSAQVLTGQKDRDEAIKEIREYPYNFNQMLRDKKTVIKKLGLSKEEFNVIWDSPNKTFHDYPSHFNLFMNNKKYIKKYSYLVMPNKPKMIVIEE
jgi:hypothetical protein